MVNPQREDGHLDIANEIVDKLCAYRIPGQEWQILWVILRKTWGWLQNPRDKKNRAKKKMDYIALSQFSTMTGIPRPKCVVLLKSLINKNIVIKRVTKKGNRKIISYGFNKHYNEWRVLPKKVTAPKGVPQKGNLVLPEKGHTKESITKETNMSSAQKRTNPDVKRFIDWWYQRFEKKFKEKYSVSGGKEGKLLKELLSKYPYDKLIELGEKFFRSQDKFIKDSGYTVGVFASVINKLLAQGQHNLDPELYA